MEQPDHLQKEGKMKKIFQDDSGSGYAAYVSRGEIFISNRYGTRRASGTEITKIKKLIHKHGRRI